MAFVFCACCCRWHLRNLCEIVCHQAFAHNTCSPSIAKCSKLSPCVKNYTGAGVGKGNNRVVGPVRILSAAMSSFGFICRQVRISELKEIVSYRGGTVPTALDPAFDLGSSLYGSAAAMVAAPSSPKASASSPRASASSPTAANRQQLRDAVSSLSLYIDHVDDHVSPLSSPAQASANAIAAASHTSRIAAATRQLIHTLALEDGSRYRPLSPLSRCVSAAFLANPSQFRPGGPPRR